MVRSDANLLPGHVYQPRRGLTLSFWQGGRIGDRSFREEHSSAGAAAAVRTSGDRRVGGEDLPLCR